MTNEWHRFLAKRGARIAPTSGRVEDFGERRRELAAAFGDGALLDASDLRVLRARGADADTFLQDQLTNDLRAVREDTHGLGAYCNVKGRVISVFRVARRDDAWLFVMPLGVLEPTLKKLELYRMRAAVELEDASDALAVAELVGERAADALERELGALPRGAGKARAVEDLSVLCIADRPPRWMLVGAPGDLARIWTSVAREVTEAGSATRRLFDIRAGLPFVSAETSEAFLPQMLNLDLVGGVSFDKGCFPGQEVVARTQHLGAVKRRVFRARCEGDGPPPAPGTPLRALRDGGERDGGRVIEAQHAPDHGYELLAVLPLAEANGSEIRVGGAEGPRLELLDLPYTVPGT